MEYPKITIVTPSYNQGQYLEETILSVIGQCYPNLEYIIIDGGSTDNSVEIIKKYEKYLAYWVSEPDNGQSHAINKGFQKATGSILAWLNSDDMYLPGVFYYIAQQINSETLGLYFGNCIHIKNENNALISWGSDVKRFNAENLELFDYIIQPSTFWTKKTWQIVGDLREDLYYGFDWEWFLRAKKNGVIFIPISNPLSLYRIHNSSKTGTGKKNRQKELLSIYSNYNVFYKELYEKITDEGINIFSLKYRIINKIFRVLKCDSSYASMLKFIKKKKYQEYTTKEITLIKRML